MGLGGSDTLWGQTKVSAAEAQENENLLSAKRVVDIPSNMQMFCDYDVRTDTQPIYIGWAPKALAAGTDGWLLYKFTYDGSNRVTSRQIAYGNWTGHTTASYS